MYEGPIIDPDVHHSWKSEDWIIDHLSPRWREFARASGRGHVPLAAPGTHWPHLHGVNKRLDGYPADGSPSGSDYETMKRQLLDPFHIERAILSFDVGTNPGVFNADFAIELCRAINDWNIEYWLGMGDPRLYSAILVPTRTPEAAAREIRRVAPRHGHLAEVLLVYSGLGKPFGDPAYDPIYAAAAEVGLPIALHVGGELTCGAGRAMAGGMAGSRLEMHAVASQPTLHHLVSLITHGTFEKFPSLKLMLIEVGVAWIPWLMFTLDAQYPILRLESPWVKRLPSETFREHVRVTTQPCEFPEQPKRLIELLQCFDGIEDLLCFCTDYAHWDEDEPAYVGSRFPRAWWPKLFWDNAAWVYGFPRLDTAGRAG